MRSLSEPVSRWTLAADFVRYSLAAASVAPRTLLSVARGRMEPEIPDGGDFGRMRHQLVQIVEVDGPVMMQLAIAAAHAAGQTVSFGGSRHSANGQTLPRRPGIQIRADRTGGGWTAPEMVDEEHVRIAGIHTWKTLQDFLRARGRTCPVLTDHLTTSIGGTLSVGGGIGTASIACGRQLDTVRAFTLILPNGERRTCSADENPELFRHVMGGFGELGVIEDVVLWTRPYVPWLAIHRFQARSIGEAMDLVHQALYDPAMPDSLAHLVVEGPILGTPFVQFELGFEAADQQTAQALLDAPPAPIAALRPWRRTIGARALVPTDQSNDRHNRSAAYVSSLVDHKHLWNDYFFADFASYRAFLTEAERILEERGHEHLMSGLAFAYPGDPLDPIDPDHRRAAFSYPAREAERYRWSFGFNFSVPAGPAVAPVVETLDLLRRTATALGAGVYGYGYDQRVAADFEQAYGAVVDDFRRLKDRFDPDRRFGGGLPIAAQSVSGSRPNASQVAAHIDRRSRVGGRP